MPYKPQRTGAPSFWELITKACKLSRNPLFQTGFLLIAGDNAGSRNVLSAWYTFCSIWETFIALDDASGQIEATPGEGQDRPEEPI